MERAHACAILQIHMQGGKFHLPQRKECFANKSIQNNYELFKRKSVLLRNNVSVQGHLPVHFIKCVTQNILCDGKKRF